MLTPLGPCCPNSTSGHVRFDLEHIRCASRRQTGLASETPVPCLRDTDSLCLMFSVRRGGIDCIASECVVCLPTHAIGTRRPGHGRDDITACTRALFRHRKQTRDATMRPPWLTHGPSQRSGTQGAGGAGLFVGSVQSRENVSQLSKP